jgi:hypothetical protein
MQFLFIELSRKQQPVGKTTDLIFLPVFPSKITQKKKEQT